MVALERFYCATPTFLKLKPVKVIINRGRGKKKGEFKTGIEAGCIHSRRVKDPRAGMACGTMRSDAMRKPKKAITHEK